MGTFLGVALAAIKPLWIWGTVVSSIGGLTTSGLVLNKINKKDPEFKEYLQNRGPVKNVLHFLKSVAKLFIPIFNVFYGFHLITNLVNLGTTGLKDKWKNKIKTADDRLDDIKSIGKSIKRIGSGLIAKIRNRKSNTQEITKTQTVKPVVTAVNKPTTVNTVKTQPVVKKTPVVNNTQTISKKTTTVKQPVTLKSNYIYESLVEYLDSLNHSNIDTNELIAYYKREYWSARRKYDNLVANGLDASKEYAKITLLHDKCMEFKQLRGLTQKPNTLALK